MGRYSKGFMAAFGTTVTAGMSYVEQFCGTWLPALAAFLTTVGVVAVSNARKSDDQR